MPGTLPSHVAKAGHSVEQALSDASSAAALLEPPASSAGAGAEPAPLPAHEESASSLPEGMAKPRGGLLVPPPVAKGFYILPPPPPVPKLPSMPTHPGARVKHAPTPADPPRLSAVDFFGSIWKFTKSFATYWFAIGSRSNDHKFVHPKFCHMLGSPWFPINRS